MKTFLSIGLFALLFVPSYSQNTWTTIDDYPGVGRDDAVAFAIDGIGYVGTGSDYPLYYRDFAKYDPATGNWTPIDTFGGLERRNAIAFVIGGFAYVGLGYGGNVDTGYSDFNDMWKYDPIGDTWTQLNNFPAAGREGAIAFVIGSKAYVGSGGGNDFWEYDPSGDSWTQLGNMPLSDERKNAVAFTIGGTGYFGTGINKSLLRTGDLWAYDPGSDTWTRKEFMPSPGRSNCVAFVLEGYGYVGVGSTLSTTLRYISRYDPNTDSWDQVADYPTFTDHLTSFVIDDIAYVGTGNGPGQRKEFYYYTPGAPPVVVAPLQAESEYNLAPNPSNGQIEIRFSSKMTDEAITVEVLDLNGQKLRSQSLRPVSNPTVDVSGLPNGIYICVIKKGGLQFAIKKLVIINR